MDLSQCSPLFSQRGVQSLNEHADKALTPTLALVLIFSYTQHLQACHTLHSISPYSRYKQQFKILTVFIYIDRRQYCFSSAAMINSLNTSDMNAMHIIHCWAITVQYIRELDILRYYMTFLTKQPSCNVTCKPQRTCACQLRYFYSCDLLSTCLQDMSTSFKL